MQTSQDKAKEIFGKYAAKHNVYFTADGTAFFDEGLAKHHSASLKDKSIVTISRAEVLSAGKEELETSSVAELMESYAEHFGKDAPLDATVEELTEALTLDEEIDRVKGDLTQATAETKDVEDKKVNAQAAAAADEADLHADMVAAHNLTEVDGKQVIADPAAPVEVPAMTVVPGGDAEVPDGTIADADAAKADSKAKK